MFSVFINLTYITLKVSPIGTAKTIITKAKSILFAKTFVPFINPTDRFT